METLVSLAGCRRNFLFRLCVFGPLQCNACKSSSFAKIFFGGRRLLPLPKGEGRGEGERTFQTEWCVRFALWLWPCHAFALTGFSCRFSAKNSGGIRHPRRYPRA